MLTYIGSLWLVALSVYMCYKDYVKCFYWFRHFNLLWYNLEFRMQGNNSLPNQIHFFKGKKKKVLYTWLMDQATV